jgi:vacuole morphology and inheritance protein 14
LSNENPDCANLFSIEEFIPLLRERMNVLNPYVRQFLVGWITVLDSVPDIDMLGFLPDFLDGMCSFPFESFVFIFFQYDRDARKCTLRFI